nr:hypothetical protein [Tanacetum cinerariifolium]
VASDDLRDALSVLYLTSTRLRNDLELDLSTLQCPDYIPGPEEPEQAPPSPDYILGLEHDDDEIVTEDQPYAEDASPIAQSPEDRRAHAYTRHLMETEAMMSRETWVRATDASDLVHGEVMSLRTTVLEANSYGGVIGLAIFLPLYLVDALDLVENDCFNDGAYDL